MDYSAPMFDSKPWKGIGVNCQFIFHLLGNQKITAIFLSPFSEVLDYCAAKVPKTGPVDLPNDGHYVEAGKLKPIEDGLKALSVFFKRTTPANAAGTTWAETTLADLITWNVAADQDVRDACGTLKQHGCFFAFDHIPQGMEHHAKSLIQDYKFLDPASNGMGDISLGYFLETGAKANPQSYMTARKAKMAGIFKVLADPFGDFEIVRPRIVTPASTIGEGNGQCCSPLTNTCRAVVGNHNPDDFYCEPSNPQNPQSPCNSLSDPCP